MSGKLQVFFDNEYLFSATLRRNKDGAEHPFTLRIYNSYGNLIFMRGWYSAMTAKNFLENYPDTHARWYTDRGFVCDDELD